MIEASATEVGSMYPPDFEKWRLGELRSVCRWLLPTCG
jgi:hypothetical protein